MFVLISLTAVSAVDTNQTDDLAAEDSDTVTQDILTDESVGDGDFKELNDNVTSATTTLELTKNYTYNPDVDLDYKDGINITKDITVDGKGYTIDGNSQSRIFNIVNATVTLKNINFINGNASSGGAICFERGNLTIIGCNFSNNVGNGTSSMGGAIFFEGNDLLIADSKFMSNEAYEYGAVFADSLTAEVRNTEFSKNAAEDYGALAVLGGDLLIDKCNFTDNSAGYYGGGAILFREINATVSDCIFTKNSAKEAGAIQWIGGKGRILNSKFIGNTAKSFTATGGAIDILNTEAFKVLNSTFTDNYATYEGAAICAGNCSGSEISDCIFNNNRAGNGGAIHWYNSNEIQISDCNFTNNAAKDDGEGGAVVYSFCTNDTIANCIFINNTARDGGAISSEECLISECIFMNNIGQRGGALSFWMEYPAHISNCNFINNSANEGGAIYVSRWSKLITIENASFINNTADSDGGAIYAGNIVFVTNSNFTDNAADNGGAISSDSNLTVNECQFSSNHADNEGGAVYFVGNDLAIDSSIFENNTVDLNSAAINFNGTSLLVNNSEFKSNKAEEFAGAIGVDEANDVKIINTNFYNNAAKNYAVLGIYDGNVSIDNCTFENNHADEEVGVAYLNCENSLINGSDFIENTAKDTMVTNAGGNLTVYHSSFMDNYADSGNIIHNAIHANLTLLNSIFDGDCFKGRTITNNYGNLYLHNNDIYSYYEEIYSYGGKITSHVFAYILSNETHYVHLNESIVIYFEFYDDNNNLIRFDDFDLFVNDTKLDCIFNEENHFYEANFSAEKLESYTVYITSASLTNLTSENGEIVVVNVTDDFSALKKLIDNANGTVTLDKNYTFNNLTDDGLYNGIVIDKNITIDGAGFTIDGIGKARIFNVQSDNVTLTNITFINAKSNSDGGAIFWDGDDGRIIGCSFSNNEASSGAAVNWGGDRGTVINCTFINNTAKYSSALESYGSYLKVSGSTFINNYGG